MNVNISVNLTNNMTTIPKLSRVLVEHSRELAIDALSVYLTDLSESIILDLHKINAGLTQNLCICGYPTDDFIFQVSKLLPKQITLVSTKNKNTSIFTDAYSESTFIKWREAVSLFGSRGILTSVLVNADFEQIKGASLLGVDRVLINVSSMKYNDLDSHQQLERFQNYIDYARSLGLSVNLSGGFNSKSIKLLDKNLYNIKEFSWDKTIMM